MWILFENDVADTWLKIYILDEYSGVKIIKLNVDFMHNYFTFKCVPMIFNGWFTFQYYSRELLQICETNSLRDANAKNTEAT